MTYNQMMKRQQLHAEYSFTGVYYRSYESDKIKEAKKRPEFKGYKTKTVREDGGVSLYIENKYFKDRARNKLEKKIDSYEARRASLQEKYLESLKALENEQNEDIAKLNEMKEGDAK